MRKSETSSGIEIPDVIMADDRSVCTEMSDIQSPLSVARKKMIAHMINERIVMLKEGMTPQEIVAHYEKLEGGGKKKSKSSSRKTKNSKAPAIPEAIPEVPDLVFGAGSSVGLPPPPPPPFGMTEDLASASSQFRKGQTFKEMMLERPSHFQAFQKKGSEAPLRQDRFNMKDNPRPSHFAAFEEASYSSGKKNRAHQQNGVIQTKSLLRMRTVGDAAPPHYLALEMESKKSHNNKKAGGTMRRRSSIKRSDGEVEELSHYNSKKLDEKLNSLRDHFDYEKRTDDADLSAELSAFWAKQRKTQKANSMKKLERASPNAATGTTKLARTSDAVSTEYASTATIKLTRGRTSDAAGTMDYSTASSHRRALSGNGMSSRKSAAFPTRMERLNQSSSDRVKYVAPVNIRHRSLSSDGIGKMERSSTERREQHRKMEKMLAAEKKNPRKHAKVMATGENQTESWNVEILEKTRVAVAKEERRSIVVQDIKKKSGGYQEVQMRVSASRSPPPPESR